MTYLPYDGIVDKLTDIIRNESNGMGHFFVAIDGMSGTGKTFLAEALSKNLPAFVIHTDDFFLPFPKRTADRMKNPGWNFDYERFTREVARPFLSKETPEYGIYNCRIRGMAGKVSVPDKEIYIIEGSYSLHPEVPDFYDLRIVLKKDEDARREAILQRDGAEKLERFNNEWFPLEETYMKTYMTEELSDIVVTDGPIPESNDMETFDGFTMPFSLDGEETK